EDRKQRPHRQGGDGQGVSDPEQRHEQAQKGKARDGLPQARQPEDGILQRLGAAREDSQRYGDDKRQSKGGQGHHDVLLREPEHFVPVKQEMLPKARHQGLPPFRSFPRPAAARRHTAARFSACGAAPSRPPAATRRRASRSKATKAKSTATAITAAGRAPATTISG